MQRRSFLKIAGAASLLPAHTRRWDMMSTFQNAQPGYEGHGNLELAKESQKLVFTFEEDGRIGYQSLVRDEKGAWVNGSVPSNPLVFGPSFNFYPDVHLIERTDNYIVLRGNGRAQGKSAGPVEYHWESRISSEPGSPWFRLHTVLRLPEPVQLQQAKRLEPQIILWLNATSTMMEGQSASWRRVLLAQPTENSLGARGNDLPAVYLLDQNAGIETMMYFDIGEMGWMSLENIPRFLGYRCTTVSELGRDGTQKLGIGLVADQATGNTLAAGEVRFSYRLLQRRETQLLNEQEAVRRWMEALLPLFEEDRSWPACATTWKEFAAGTATDVQQKETVVINVNGHTGLRAYVKATSELWKEPGNNFELMTMADVLWPSLLYLKLESSPGYEDLSHRLLESMPFFYHDDTRSISNDFVRGPRETADSWYPFENSLIKYPTIGMLAGSKALTGNFLNAFDTATKLAHQYNYLFPIYYHTQTLDQLGAGTNYAVGGLYAWGALIAHRLTGEDRYRDEARRAVEILHTVRAARLFHEPQELAYGALAAMELGMPDAARYLLYEQLRMFYWCSDPSQKRHDIRGMVQAAASILYPAFKENVEAILPWTGVMKRGLVIEALLRFMDQQRRNNFYFFENCSGDHQKTPMRYIPFENLGTLELGGATGNVGKEVYGSGEVLWMYLMFEALGTVADRELMLVSLDLMDTVLPDSFPPRELNFILYNPMRETRQATITIPPAKGAPVRLTIDGRPAEGSIEIDSQRYLRVKAEF